MAKNEFAGLIALHFQRLKKYLGRRVADPQAAEEIFQQTLISAMDGFPFFQGRSAFFTWLAGVANHEISDYYRKRKIKVFLFSRFPWLEEIASQALGPEQALLEEEMRQTVRAAVNLLSEGYQEVLRLKYYQGLSIKQIASRLNESYKAIESRLTRARKALAQVYLAERF